jgi:hypothetical protein
MAVCVVFVESLLGKPAGVWRTAKQYLSQYLLGQKHARNVTNTNSGQNSKHPSLLVGSFHQTFCVIYLLPREKLCFPFLLIKMSNN